MSQYNVAIIGGGPGGYVAAIKAAQQGLKTVLVEKDWIGGTCLNIGCIPTKTLVKDAEILHQIKHAGRRGIKVGAPEIDMPTVIKMKNKVVSQLTGGVRSILTANGVQILMGSAVVMSTNMLKMNDEEITFDNLIIATGSSNFIPPVPGLGQEGILTSTELLNIDHVPARLSIIGGGVIGCELATVFANFGSKVTLIEMMSDLVPNMDLDISKELKRRLSSLGVSVMTGCRVTAVEADGDAWTVKVDGGNMDTISVDNVLVSVGRRSNLAGLEALGLELEKNYIKVNDKMETSIPHVYAIGDVTGRIQLAHVASAQGIVAAENIAGEEALMSYDVVPSCIYTIPEIGSVGLTEAKARELYGEVSIGKFPMAACGKALAMGESDGFTKVIADKKTGKLVGCHIIGANATEIIGEAAAVMHAGGTLTDICKTIHAHPTVTESIAEAAEIALGTPIHMMP